nr:hypothetical protein CFP56_34706 [Quercus suber]
MLWHVTSLARGHLGQGDVFADRGLAGEDINVSALTHRLAKFRAAAAKPGAGADGKGSAAAKGAGAAAVAAAGGVGKRKAGAKKRAAEEVAGDDELEGEGQKDDEEDEALGGGKRIKLEMGSEYD